MRPIAKKLNHVDEEVPVAIDEDAPIRLARDCMSLRKHGLWGLGVGGWGLARGGHQGKI